MTTLSTVAYVLVRTLQSNTTLVVAIVITLDSVKVILIVVNAVPITEIQQSIINVERRKLMYYLKMDHKKKVSKNMSIIIYLLRFEILYNSSILFFCIYSTVTTTFV